MSLKQFKRDESGKFVPTAAFKMPRSMKYLFSTIVNDESRNRFKYAMAQAVMQSFEVIESKKKKNAAGKLEVEPA